MNSSSHNDLLQKNITKTYKKVTNITENSINNESKCIATKLNLNDRINTTAKREAFITLKDHKPNFANNPTCRLINPAKSELGKVNKQILDRINRQLINKFNLKLWKNTKSILQWFNNIQEKKNFSFIGFDVVDFYPSITLDLLTAALDFASKHVSITDDEIQILLHSKKSLLYNAGEPWVKKSSSNFFDITMGSYDGAESCELVGAYILHAIKEKYGDNFGLYRDDGLGVIDASPRQIEIIKKDLCAIFKHHGLKITIEVNKKIVNFLDVTLNLTSGIYMPYTKPNNVPLYVHKKSNHPPRIIENIPKAINKRLCEISYDDESFKSAAPLYQKALNDSGYSHQLTFSPKKTDLPSSNRTRRNRHRDIIWYNPPFSKNVATNIGRTFLKLLDEEFPKGNVLHKIFNRNTVKISYSCMTNIKQSIDGHNKAILNKTDNETKSCNCRKPDACPLTGNCQKKSIIYQATVTTDNEPPQTYIGLTENTFKTRFTNHKASFNNFNKRLNTELSKYIWKLKEEDKPYKITWKILKHANAYNPSSNRCNLCLWEKFYIICKPDQASLNKRNELITSCRHANKFLLRNFKLK